MTTSPAALRPTVNTGLPLGTLFPGAPDVTVTGVSLDSRSVRPGDLYVAVAGLATHGARFAAQAIGSGAVAVVTDLREPARPCGACRQVLAEFGIGMHVLLGGRDGAVEATTLDRLLPEPFTFADVRRSTS